MTVNPLTAVTLVACLAIRVAVPQVPTFHAETRLVVLHVTVTDGHGELITNLDRHAFTVYEDGRRQTIALFRRDDVPVSLGLIIDNSGSMRPLRSTVEASALAFVRASNPLDEAFVLNFADTPRIDVPLSNDVGVLEAGIARVDSIGGTAVRDAILAAEQYLRDHATRDRRALLVITDGNDNASTVSKAELRRVIERNDAVIFAVSLVPDGSPGGERRHDAQLEELVQQSGGVLYRVASLSDVNRVVVQIASQMRQQYTIAYTSTNKTLDGSYRSVRVEVTGQRGLAARTRPGYWATASSPRFGP